MNTETKTEWRLTDEVLAGLQASFEATTQGGWRKGHTTHHTVCDGQGRVAYHIAEFHHAADAEFCDNAHAMMPELLAEIVSLRKLLNAAPTPQASEPVAITESGRYGTRLTWYSEEAQTNTPAGVLLYDHAKPCERCAELEEHVGNMIARIHRDGGHYQSTHGTDKAIADADIMVANAYAKLDALEAETARLTEERNEALLIYQTDTGTESAVAALQNTVEKQAEQLAAAQAKIDEQSALVEKCRIVLAWINTYSYSGISEVKQVLSAIAAQKEGK